MRVSSLRDHRAASQDVLTSCFFIHVMSNSFNSIDIAKCSSDIDSDKAMDAEVVNWELFANDISLAVVVNGIIDEVQCLEQENG